MALGRSRLACGKRAEGTFFGTELHLLQAGSFTFLWWEGGNTTAERAKKGTGSGMKVSRYGW